MEVTVIVADYRQATHAAAIVKLMSAYARDPMGGGRDLTETVKQGLVAKLAQIPTAMSVLAFVGAEPAGLANCFEGFSTFKCQPLMNIHDVVVLPAYRGYGLSRRMLALVEQQALGRGCCKLTLEVLEGNRVAQQAYRKFGFAGYELDPGTGTALFWEKTLAPLASSIEESGQQ